MIVIDGSYGEGGGQLLRTTVALSAITGRGVRVKSIRAGRPNPGMQAQHLKGVEAVAGLCDAETHGATLGSTELIFEPGRIEPRPLNIDIGTAGAVTLVLQALILAAARTEGTTTIDLTGGTHVAWSPPTNHFSEVFCKHLRAIGIEVNLEIMRYGFYPKGGGRIHVEIRGNGTWQALTLERAAHVDRTSVKSVASEELRKPQVAERQIAGFKSVLGGEIAEEAVYVPSFSIGSSLFAAATCGPTTLGADSLGKKGVRAEEVGKETARKLKAEIDSNASVDIHAADMILPYLALASGPSRFTVRELSGHMTSVQWLLRQFVDVDFRNEKKGNLFEVSTIPKGDPGA